MQNKPLSDKSHCELFVDLIFNDTLLRQRNSSHIDDIITNVIKKLKQVYYGP